MWAFFRPGSTEVASHVANIIDAHLAPLRSQPEDGMHRITPSKIAPSTARFDSLHLRDPVAPTIRLAHIFVDIMPHPPASEDDSDLLSSQG